MSLFGAAKKTSTFQRAKERMDKAMAKPSRAVHTQATSSSGEGAQLEQMGRGAHDLDGTATTSEIAREGADDMMGGLVVLPREIYNEAVRMHNQEAREVGHDSQAVSTVHGGSSVDEKGNLVYEQPRIYMIPSSRSGRQRSSSLDSQESSRLLSPPPTTDYGGDDISFPGNSQSTKYWGV